ncbi:MAG: CRISPR-associated endonuclease Cas2 [Duodenibacillus sp.]|nr:CRISPR-associated endonuclease Cas2 [Duodenibacillus sp.]
MGTYVIGYDIADPKRLIRVHRAMVQHGCPIEYSIFVFDGTKEALDKCLEAVLKLIDPRVDDVRCYAVPARGDRMRIGAPALPEGIIWTGLPAAWR